MALDGSFVINTSNAWVGLADEGTAKPTFTAAPAATSIAGWDFEATTALGYTMIGHTSEETAITLAVEVEGGERLGSLQRSSLRETRITATRTITMAALQGDNTVLSLYFGGGDATQPDYFGVPKTYTAPRKAALIVIGDSAGYNMPLWVPLASVKPEGDVEFGTDALTEFGLSLAVLDDDGADDLLGFFRVGLGTPL